MSLIDKIVVDAFRPRFGKQPLGSEGLGPWIERAASGRSLGAKAEALRWLGRCQHIEPGEPGLRDHLATLRGPVERATVAGMARAEQLVAQACQTVTDQHQALAPALAQSLAEGRWPGGAVDWLRALREAKAPPATREAAERAVIQSARQGDWEAVRHGAVLGQSLDSLPQAEYRVMLELVLHADSRSDIDLLDLFSKDEPAHPWHAVKVRSGQALSAEARDWLQRCCKGQLPNPEAAGQALRRWREQGGP